MQENRFLDLRSLPNRMTAAKSLCEASAMELLAEDVPSLVSTFVATFSK